MSAPKHNQGWRRHPTRTMGRFSKRSIITVIAAAALALVGALVFASPASAHTASLTVTQICDHGTGEYKILYTGNTVNVPVEGRGYVATFSVDTVLPASTITGAPLTVEGNTTFSFTQTVPGTSTYAQATAHLVWGDGATSNPQGTITLAGDCTKTPEKPTVNASIAIACDGTATVSGTGTDGAKVGLKDTYGTFAYLGPTIYVVNGAFTFPAFNVITNAGYHVGDTVAFNITATNAGGATVTQATAVVPAACLTHVTPVQPTVVVISACGTYGSVTPVATNGVTYTVSPAGAKEGTVTVTATANEGFVLDGYTTPWSFDLGKYTVCVTPPTSNPPTTAPVAAPVTPVTPAPPVNKGTQAGPNAHTNYDGTFASNYTHPYGWMKLPAIALLVVLGAGALTLSKRHGASHR